MNIFFFSKLGFSTKLKSVGLAQKKQDSTVTLILIYLVTFVLSLIDWLLLDFNIFIVCSIWVTFWPNLFFSLASSLNLLLQSPLLLEDLDHVFGTRKIYIILGTHILEWIVHDHNFEYNDLPLLIINLKVLRASLAFYQEWK